MTNQLKEKLLSRQQKLSKQSTSGKKSMPKFNQTPQYDQYQSFETFEGYKEIQQAKKLSDQYQVPSPFFLCHDGIASAVTSINHQEYINFSSYNYLNLNGDSRVSQAAKQAIDQYGTSASASRIVSGQRPPQSSLEQHLATLYQADDALVFVSGHATNVTSIGYLFGHNDLIIHDELIHNSVLEGVKLAGAKHFAFKHNDCRDVERLLKKYRHQYQRVLVVVEGLYSMDGDFPDLPQLIALKNQYATWLMVDEAHALGVLGQTGRGIAEHFDVNPKDVDIWMGTLSKTLSGCGGYLAGCQALIEHLRYKAPGFLYSVGISPPLAMACDQALSVMLDEPERVEKLQYISRYFCQQAQKTGLDIGNSQGYGVNVVMIGQSRKAVNISNELRKYHINVQPVIYPSVEPNKARLRFFMNCEHTEEQVEFTIKKLSQLI